MDRLSEDWLAVLIGGVLLILCLGSVLPSGGAEAPLKPLIRSPTGWSDSPAAAFDARVHGVTGAGVLLGCLFAAATPSRVRFAKAFAAVFALATLSVFLSKQETVAYYGLAYALWAIVLGLLIANTVGVPDWLRPALRTELYMKVGLVLLGAEVLLSRLLELGLPGVCVAWIVTPIVLCSTFWFGQRVLRIESPSLNMVISADMSVCGVSAAIATAAACRAKKEELSLAIGLSMAFTVGMLLAMPPIVRALDLPPAVGGAWIGGTIDATGAVGAAGELLSTGEDDTALVTATTIKMIQNILIGVVAFCVATYWVTQVEAKAESDSATPKDATFAPPPSAFIEVWRRFPKFILGFLAASLTFSLIYQFAPSGEAIVESSVRGVSKTLRGWCFALAFVSIGLETDFRRLAGVLRGGKPLALYVAGQSLNLVLTFAMAWLMFGVLFPGAGQPPMAEGQEAESRAERLEAVGVDPGAFFYTDHPRAWRQSDRSDSVL
ncbi:hypothetical protein MalM25_32770 [Planctomycetes bacterium MalM25]|nr:hypothetical protein MalM25_32770 [Planctomycetes bacterium MalM25]